MSPVDPRIFGLTPEGGQAQTIGNLKARMAMRERAGSSAGGGTGSVADATTTLKGKLKLGGDLDGTADLPRVRGLIDRELAANTLAGDFTITVHTTPAQAANIGFVIVDAFTVQAEARRVTAVSGTTLTVAALTYAHAAGDRVLFVDGDVFPVTWWGAKGDAATNDAPAFNAAIDSVFASNNNGAGIVTVPPSQHNIYRMDAQVNMKGRVQLWGSGQGTRLAWNTDLGVGSYAIDMSTGSDTPVIRHLLLEGPYQPSTIKPTVKTITGATVSGGTTTFTSTAHGLVTGDRVLVVDVLMTSGTGVNGMFTVTGAAANTFDVAVSTTSTAWSSGGIAICPLVRMGGIKGVSGGILENVYSRGFFAGLHVRDHQIIRDSFMQGNFYGVYWDTDGQGDIHFYSGKCDTNRMASFASNGNTSGIGSHFFGVHIGGGPYCFYMEPVSNATTKILGGICEGSSMEGYGNAAIWGDRKDGSLAAGAGAGKIDSVVWTGMGDGVDIGSAAQTIAERPQTWGYRGNQIASWVADSPSCFLNGSMFSGGLFDYGTITHMEIRAGANIFAGLGAKKIVRDGTNVVRMEISADGQLVRMRGADAAVTANDLVEAVGAGGGYTVKPCTTGVPVGVARSAAAAFADVIPVVEEADAVAVRTTIASGGNSGRLVPDTANAGKVKLATAATDPDQIGVASNNSNGTTIETRLGGFGSGGGGSVADPLQLTGLGLGQAPNTFKLSLAPSTLDTGGIDFGADMSMYRVAAGRLRLAGATPNATVLDLNAATGLNSQVNLMTAGTSYWQLINNSTDGRLIFRGESGAVTSDIMTLDRATRRVVFGIVPTDNGAAGGQVSIQPTGAWDATRGATVSASDTFSMLSMSCPGGFTDGINDRLVVADDDVTATDAPNQAGVGNLTTWWYPSQSSYIFDSHGTLVSHQADLVINKPPAAVFPNTYNECGVFIGGTTVNNAGCNTRVFEGGVTVNRRNVNFDGTGGLSATPDSGPARARGMIFSVTDMNPYAAYNSTFYFGAASHYKDRGAVALDLNNTAGDGYVGTGILFRGAGALSESSPVSAFKRAIVLEDRTGYDIFTLDGEGRMGFGACNNNTVGNQLGGRIVLGYTNAGALSTSSADGIKFGPGNANLYRSAVDVLRTDGSFQVGTTFRHLGSVLGFYNTSPVTKPTVSGSRGGNAGLTSTLTGLAALGLVTDSTTDLGGLLKTSYTSAGAASTVTTDGIDFGGDISLYRVAANIVSMVPTAVGGLGSGSTASAGAGGAGVFNGSGGRVDVTRATGGIFVRGYDVSAGTPQRMSLGDGSSVANGLQFGPGTGALDTTWYRTAPSGVATMRTPNALQADGNITGLGTLALAGAATLAGTVTLTAVDGTGVLQLKEQTTSPGAPASGFLITYMDGGHLMMRTATNTRTVRADRAASDYTITNGTADRRTLDGTSGTAAEVREVLETLIEDLVAEGILA